jgi:hypothetical protein
MKRSLLVACAVGVGVLAVCGPVLAHHGNAVYEDQWTEFKQVTVTKFAWSNPHALIFFDVKNPQGEVVNWVVETAAPQALRLIGWDKTAIAPGDVITVFVYATKTGNPAGRLNRIILADGTVLHDTQLGGEAGGKTGYRPE